MFCRYILAPLAALLLVPGLLGSAAAQGRGDWDRGARDWGARDRDRDRDGDHGQRNGDQSEWVLLGTTRIGGIGVDRDVIDVGRRDGRFARIGLQAGDAPVFVLGVTVVFGNDEVQQIDLRQKLNPGERTQPLDLQGARGPSNVSRSRHAQDMISIAAAPSASMPSRCVSAKTGSCWASRR